MLSEPLPGDENADEIDHLTHEINALATTAAYLTDNTRDVTAGVAHGLQTPLSDISARLQFIDRDAADQNAARSHVDVANEHIQSPKRALDAVSPITETTPPGRSFAVSSAQ